MEKALFMFGPVATEVSTETTVTVTDIAALSTQSV